VKQDTIQVEIERIVAGGYGLARSEDGVVLVRGGLPGELVTCRPRESKGALKAFAMQILRPHPGRITDLQLPPGADLPVQYATQLEIKRELVQEAVSRIAKLDYQVAPVQPSPMELAYRTVAQYATVPQGGLGARATDSDRIIRLDNDPLTAAPLTRAFQICSSRSLHGVSEIVLRGSLLAGKCLVGLISESESRNIERLAVSLLDSGIVGVSWAAVDARGRFRGKTKHLSGSPTLVERMGDIEATVSVDSFSQVNPLAAGNMFRDVTNAAGQGDHALDLYSGSGIMAMHLASSFSRVTAIEISASAIKRGQSDAKRLGIENIEFVKGDARIVQRHGPFDVAVVDPPRAGLSPEVITALSKAPPRRLVYVSCNPTTWARDIKQLLASGYSLTHVTPFDFYPFTHHVEVLSVLDRSAVFRV
jgi:23S rRNA (uracil1939-C5)-methyltransferase